MTSSDRVRIDGASICTDESPECRRLQGAWVWGGMPISWKGDWGGGGGGGGGQWERVASPPRRAKARPFLQSPVDKVWHKHWGLVLAGSLSACVQPPLPHSRVVGVCSGSIAIAMEFSSGFMTIVSLALAVNAQQGGKGPFSFVVYGLTCLFPPASPAESVVYVPHEGRRHCPGCASLPCSPPSSDTSGCP